MTDDKTADPGRSRTQRSDAQRNHERILSVAKTVLEEQGADASLRNIARRAGVGLGTLYRHFPTRDALLEALLRQRFDHLAAKATSLQDSPSPDDALREWLADFMVDASAHRGLSASLMATLADESSLLHASCLAMREAAARLLKRTQDCGQIRPDVTGTDLFALVNALAWIADQSPSFAERREHLFSLVMDGLGCHPPPSLTKQRSRPSDQKH